MAERIRTLSELNKLLLTQLLQNQQTIESLTAEKEGYELGTEQEEATTSTSAPRIIKVEPRSPEPQKRGVPPGTFAAVQPQLIEAAKIAVLKRIVEFLEPEIAFAEAVSTFNNRHSGDLLPSRNSPIYTHLRYETIDAVTMLPPLTYPECWDDSFGRSLLQRAAAINWDAARLTLVGSDDYIFDFSPTLRNNTLLARSMLSSKTRNPEINGWPLRAFLLDIETRMMFANYAAHVALAPQINVPSSDMFDKTFDRVSVLVLGDALRFLNARYDGERVTLGHSSPERTLRFVDFPARRYVSRVLPSY